MAYRRLGELLIAAGSITEEQLNKALQLQKGTNQRLGSVLISNHIITEDQLIESLQMQLGIDFVDLSKVNIPVEMAQVVSKNIAKQYQIVPLRIVKDELYLAMVDPLNFYAIEEVRKTVRKKIVPVVATSNAMEHAIQVLYGNEGAARAIADMKREAVASGQEQELDAAFTANQLDSYSPESAPTIRLVNSIIERAISEHASDIHLEPQENELLVRMRIDGMMRLILTVPKNLQGAVISRLKIISGLDIAERRVPQDGRFNVRIKDKNIDLRVSTLPTVYGEKIVARLLDRSDGLISKEAIGLIGDDLKKYEKMIHCHAGVVLLVGPTGSGKTTTMYTMIQELNSPEINLVTLEDPVEYNFNGVNQVQINEKTGMTFPIGLRAILRQDPDIIAIGEIRDGQTAEIAMRAAITGHVVLSTIHTNDAVGTVERLKDIGVEPYLISSAVKGIISQRLVRKICPQCKTEYIPDEEELDNLGMKEEKGVKFYRGKGCSNCFNTGYRGRIAVFEIFQINRKIRSMISEGKERWKIEQELQNPENGFVSMQDNAKRLIREGVTTSDEILRVIYEDD